VSAVSVEESYAVAFKLGAVVSILLGLLAFVGPTLAALAALAVWSLVTLFVLPWCYVCYRKGTWELPPWVEAYRGPHQ